MLKFHWKKSLKPNQLSEFCMYTGAMLGAGVPLVKSMEILQKGSGRKRIRKLYGDLEISMQKGNSFTTALEETGVFPEFLLNMFRAAEANGRLEETAKRMAHYYKKEHRIKSQIQSATLYPKILGIVSIFVGLTIFLVVMPTVEPLFRDVELPLLTRILLKISQLIKEWWHVCLIGMIGTDVIIRLLIKKNYVRKILDRLKLYTPITGKQLRVLYTARFARSESDLYSSGLPMVEGLKIAARTIGNRHLEEQFETVVDMVQGGESLSRAIMSVDGFDAKLALVISVGEESGRLDEMLETIAESYEQEAEAAINRLVSMIEPCMIIVMGLIIGTIVLGIMLPMWSMYEYMI